MPDLDDKDLVIGATVIICLCAIFANPSVEALGLVQSALTGLFGVAVGKSLKG